MPDILSYFRRRPTGPGPSPGHRKPTAGDGAIDLASMGGTINGTYVDIASAPARDDKVRNKTVARPPRQPPPPPQPSQLPPQNEPRPQPPRQPPPPPPQNERPQPQYEARAPARTTPRAEGNGAAPASRGGFLSVHGVEKSFVGRKVVKGVSLYVRKGEAVGLLGPNGAGKTTVFYMMTGLIRADKGHIQLDGYDVTGLPMYQRARLGIGYLPQEASIFRGLNVEENIRAVLEVVEPSAKRRERDLNALLEEFNIAAAQDAGDRALRRRAPPRRDARSLATRPNYMLLDEPFAGIDPIAVGDIQSLVRHLTNRGIGVLITDHNVRETSA